MSYTCLIKLRYNTRLVECQSFHDKQGRVYNDALVWNGPIQSKPIHGKLTVMAVKSRPIHYQG